MKVNSILCLSFIQGALSRVTQEQPTTCCDNCVRAVVGLPEGYPLDLNDPIVTHRRDCSIFQSITIMPPATIVTTYKTITSVPRKPVPSYASACSSSSDSDLFASAYASACSCWNITSTIVTAETTPSTVVTLTVTDLSPSPPVAPPSPYACTQPGSCGSFDYVYDPSCGFEDKCLCGSAANGTAVCMKAVDCTIANTCITDANCGDGGVCWTKSCCDKNVCTTPSTMCPDTESTRLMYQGVKRLSYQG